MTHRLRECRGLGIGLLLLLLGLLAGPLAEARSTRPRAHVLGRGRDWQTTCWVREGPQPGPSVLIVGGQHGNEPAGAYAADQIRHWPLRAGRLLVLPRANVRALEARKRHTPGVSKALANLNRNFPDATAEDGPKRRPRGDVAPAIWTLVEIYRPDWILDLHEGFAPRKVNAKSCGRSVIAHPDVPASLEMADRLVAVVNAELPDPARHYVRLRQVTRTTLVRSAGDHFGTPTLLLETCYAKCPLSWRARRHRVMVHACLSQLGMLAEGVRVEHVLPTPRSPSELRVAVYDAEGTGGPGVPRSLAQLRKQERTTAVRVCPADIRGGVLEPFDVVVFTGGSGGRQSKALSEEGRERVHAFVEGGGGYVGICAGAYLATAGFSWSVPLLDARTVSPKWRRGRGTVDLELTAAGRRVLGDRSGRLRVGYHNGPVIRPLERDDLPDYEVWAWYRTEVAQNGSPRGVMKDSPAIAAGRCGEGRVVWISPHPEQAKGLEDVLPRAVRWAGGR